MERSKVLAIVRLGSIVLVVAAMGTAALDLMAAGTFDPTRFFAFFTIQSNIIGVVAFAWLLATRGAPRPRGLDLLRGAAVVYLTVTFFVVIFLLSGADVQLKLAWVDFVLHKFFPVIVLLDWILDPPATRLTVRDAFLWLVFPIVWVVLTLFRGASDGWYPYPFLDPADGGYGPVVVVVVAITVGFLIIAGITVAIGNARRRGAAP